MRILLILLSGAFGFASGADDAERARKVKVAIALAGTEATPVKAACGRCGTDVDSSRAEAMRTGKTLVIFVGKAGCEGKATAIPESVLTCRAKDYSGDGENDEAKPRILVMRKSGENKMMIHTVLPPDTSKDELRKTASSVSTGAPVNWYPGR